MTVQEMTRTKHIEKVKVTRSKHINEIEKKYKKKDPNAGENFV